MNTKRRSQLVLVHTCSATHECRARLDQHAMSYSRTDAALPHQAAEDSFLRCATTLLVISLQRKMGSEWSSQKEWSSHEESVPRLAALRRSPRTHGWLAGYTSWPKIVAAIGESLWLGSCRCRVHMAWIHSHLFVFRSSTNWIKQCDSQEVEQNFSCPVAMVPCRILIRVVEQMHSAVWGRGLTRDMN